MAVEWAKFLDSFIHSFIQEPYRWLLLGGRPWSGTVDTEMEDIACADTQGLIEDKVGYRAQARNPLPFPPPSCVSCLSPGVTSLGSLTSPSSTFYLLLIATIMAHKGDGNSVLALTHLPSYPLQFFYYRIVLNEQSCSCRCLPLYLAQNPACRIQSCWPEWLDLCHSLQPVLLSLHSLVSRFAGLLCSQTCHIFDTPS